MELWEQIISNIHEGHFAHKTQVEWPTLMESMRDPVDSSADRNIEYHATSVGQVHVQITTQTKAHLDAWQ